MTASLNAAAGQREPGAARLVTKPVFVLSTVRSGSTLLRCLLNSHSQLYAPSELHLRCLRVHLEGTFVPLGMDTLGITTRQLEHMLWDRLLGHLLARSGKTHFVDKTPSNVKIWDRLIECWPDAMFIVLRRNPAAIVASIMSSGHEMSRAITVVSEAVQELEHATTRLEGCHLLTYEDLTANPERCLRGICAFLGIGYEAAMLDYGRQPHGPFVYGIGDWSEKIRSGRIQPSRIVDEPEDPHLRELCRLSGYLADGPAVPAIASLGDRRDAS
jgi:hypothetical protein